jgi:hypothetical protein
MKKLNGNVKDARTIILEKAQLIALASYYGCHCTPFIDTDGRVRFEVRGPVTEALASVQNNSLIHIGDYLSKLESVRSLIFSLKDARSLSRSRT